MEQYDYENIYCKKLGHQVPFKYCRTVNSGIPCQEVLNCCFERFNIEAFILKNYSEEERKVILAPPRDKISSLLDLADQARNRA